MNTIPPQIYCKELDSIIIRTIDRHHEIQFFVFIVNSITN